MLFYENVYSVSREYNERFELLYVPLNNQPSLIRRVLAIIRSGFAVRNNKPAKQASTRPVHNSAV